MRTTHERILQAAAKNIFPAILAPQRATICLHLDDELVASERSALAAEQKKDSKTAWVAREQFAGLMRLHGFQPLSAEALAWRFRGLTQKAKGLAPAHDFYAGWLAEGTRRAAA